MQGIYSSNPLQIVDYVDKKLVTNEFMHPVQLRVSIVQQHIIQAAWPGLYIQLAFPGVKVRFEHDLSGRINHFHVYTPFRQTLQG